MRMGPTTKPTYALARALAILLSPAGIAAQCILLLVAPVAGQTRPPASSCEVCHSDEAVAYTDSAHKLAGISCEECHGGNSSDMEMTAMSARYGFEPAPSRQEIPEHCASCHADRERMAHIGLPVDQLEEYRISRHGAAWANGNEAGAVCTDCHSAGAEKGRHDILPVEDPRSSVCAGEPAPDVWHVPLGRGPHVRLGLAHRSGRALHQERSMGARLFWAAIARRRRVPHATVTTRPCPLGSRASVACAANATIPVRDMVLDSVHGPITNGRAGPDQEPFSECLTCHSEPDKGGHGIAAPTLAIYDTVCATCHSPGSEEYGQGVHISSLITDAETALTDALAEIERAREAGFITSAWSSMLDEGRTEMIQASLAQHTLRLNDVDRHTQAVESAYDQIKNEVDAKFENQVYRKGALVAVWAFLAWSYLRSRVAPAPGRGPVARNTALGGRE